MKECKSNVKNIKNQGGEDSYLIPLALYSGVDDQSLG